jgi:uncharacterized protein
MSGDEDTRLLEAAKSGDEDEVSALLERGADPNTRDPEQAWTPLMRALEADHVGVAERLIEAGADVNAAAETGTTVLMVGAGRGHAEIVNLLLEGGADASATDMHGKTALDVVGVLVRFNSKLEPVQEILVRARSG